MTRKERFEKIREALEEAFPKAEYELNFGSPYELMVAITLAARCTDQLVNELTPTIFRTYPDAERLANADATELLRLIAPVTHAEAKANYLIEAAKMTVGQFGGEVPRNIIDLTRLPGIGRKSANAILAHAFGTPAIVVDTHVARTSQRLKIATATTPDAIERQLCAITPREQWIETSNRLTLLGRHICTFANPQCDNCPVKETCKTEATETKQLSLF